MRKIRIGLVSVTLACVSCLSVSAETGLVWDQSDLDEWRIRSEEGPYKVSGDAFDPAVPGEWTRIADEAKSFRQSPSAERKSSISNNNGAGQINNHKIMLSAAFYALVEEDDELKDLVKTELLWHARQGALQIDTSTYLNTDLGNWWQPAWLARMLMAADFVKDSFSSSELNEFNAWLSKWAQVYEESVHVELSKYLFPQRLNRDYSDGYYVRNTKADAYAYIDENGTPRNMIDRAHKHYNNRRASVMEFVGLFGAWTDDAELIDHSKLYFEEWLKFSVFPDGSSGEFERNDDSNRNLQQGVLYNAINMEAYAVVADALARNGDASLFEFSTRDGLHGTESAEGENAKTLKLVVDTYLDLIEGKKKWYNSSYSVGATYLLDHVSRTSSADSIGTQWVNEIWFAPIANRAWKDASVKKSYMRDANGSIPYATKLGSAGPYGQAWRGHQAIFPSVLFMFAEMEGKSTFYGDSPIDDNEPEVPSEPGDDDNVETPLPEEPEVPSDLPFDLVYSHTQNGPDFQSLDGGVIEDNVYVSVQPSAGIVSVDFYHLENGQDVLVNIEKISPFDYKGGGKRLLHDDIDGLKTVVAVVTLNDGGVHRLEAIVYDSDESADLPGSSPDDEEEESEPGEEVTSDTLPDDWEMEYFGSLDAINGGENEDYDGDSLTNYEEWQAGTDPTDAEDYLGLTPVNGVIWQSKADRIYCIQYTHDNWETSEYSEILFGDGKTMSWIDPSPGSALASRQYRILVGETY